MGRLTDFLAVQADFLKWLWKPTKAILSPVLYAAIYGVVLYTAGLMLRALPDVEIALNNGFYAFGINIQYQFAEFFAAIGVFVSLVAGVAMATFGLHSKPRDDYVGQIAPKEEETWKPQVNIEDLTGNLQLIDVAMANKLNKSEIYDMVMLSNTPIQELTQILRCAPTLAQQIIVEAQGKLAEWRRDRLIE